MTEFYELTMAMFPWADQGGVSGRTININSADEAFYRQGMMQQEQALVIKLNLPMSALPEYIIRFVGTRFPWCLIRDRDEEGQVVFKFADGVNPTFLDPYAVVVIEVSDDAVWYAQDLLTYGAEKQ